MPVAEKGSGGGKVAFLVMFAGLAGFAAIAFLILRQGDLVQDTGDGAFGVGSVARVGQVDDLAESVADTGPILVPDIASRDRDIYLNHLSTDPEDGWIAFAARPLDATRDCTLVWNAADELFDNPCGDDTFPANGEGLQTFPVLVDQNGNLTVDLNAADRSTTTTEP